MNWHYDKNGEETVLKLAKEIAAELDGFEVTQDTDRDNGRGLIHLIKGDLDIFITEGKWNTPAGKLFFQGSKPEDPHGDVYDFPKCEIGISISRKAAAIARDIERRLLPDYTRAVTQARDTMAVESERRARRDRLAENLAVRLPRGDAIDVGCSGSRGEVRFDDGRPFDAFGSIRGDVTLYLDGSAQFKIRSKNNAFLLELAELINKHSA